MQGAYEQLVPAERRLRLSKGRILAFAAFGLPICAAWIWCLLLQPEPQSLLEPVFGPWAGRLHGHRECTLATVWPVRSAVMLAVGVVLIACAAFVRRQPRRAVVLSLTGLWAVVWELAALLSVANISS